jgi:hypothetical protein
MERFGGSLPGMAWREGGQLMKWLSLTSLRPELISHVLEGIFVKFID